MDTDAFDLPEMKSGAVFFLFLMLADDISFICTCISTLKMIIFEIGSSYKQTFSMKTVYNTTLDAGNLKRNTRIKGNEGTFFYNFD